MKKKPHQKNNSGIIKKTNTYLSIFLCILCYNIVYKEKV